MDKVGNITIIEPESRFKKVDITLIENPNIDCLTLGVYTKIVVLGKKWNLNVNGLRVHLGLSDDKIRKALSLLEKEGYILRTPIRNETGQCKGWDYTIYPTPINEEYRSQAGRKKQDYRVCESPTTLFSDHSEIGGDINNRLKEILDLNKKEEIKENTKRKKESVEPTNEDHILFEEFRKKYKGKKRGHDTEFNFFISQNKDWKTILPQLCYAVDKENQLREQARVTRTFFPEPKNMQTYLNGKNRSWELYTDGFEKYDSNEYNPHCDGTSLFWNDVAKCYITPFDITTLADGYNNDNRPNGAIVMWRGWKYIWNSKTKNWEQQ